MFGREIGYGRRRGRAVVRFPNWTGVALIGPLGALAIVLLVSRYGSRGGTDVPYESDVALIRFTNLGMSRGKVFEEVMEQLETALRSKNHSVVIADRTVSAFEAQNSPR